MRYAASRNVAVSFPDEVIGFYSSYSYISQTCRPSRSVAGIALLFFLLYHNSGHYPSSCLMFKTQRFGDWTLSLGGTYSGGPHWKS
jgi:hypothetical protein